MLKNDLDFFIGPVVFEDCDLMPPLLVLIPFIMHLSIIYLEKLIS